MKKILSCLLVMLLLCGCGSTKTSEGSTNTSEKEESIQVLYDTLKEYGLDIGLKMEKLSDGHHIVCVHYNSNYNIDDFATAFCATAKAFNFDNAIDDMMNNPCNNTYKNSDGYILAIVVEDTSLSFGLTY